MLSWLFFHSIFVLCIILSSFFFRIYLFCFLQDFFPIKPAITHFYMLICQLQLKNYFIHCYVETFLSCNNFDILLVSVSFFQTYYDTYSSCILSYFFLLQISCCIYLSPVLLISLYYFHSDLSLYLVLRFSFFDNKLNQWSHSFLYITKKKKKKIIKKIYKTPPVPFIRLIHTKYHLKKVVDKVYHLH